MAHINRSTRRHRRLNQLAHNGVADVKTTSYDHESGVAYDELEISGSRGAGNWISEYRSPGLVHARAKPNDQQGARSLSAMVINRIRSLSQDLTTEALRSLPWALGETIWKRIQEDRAQSFYIWRTFASAYSHDFASKANRYMLDLRTPSLKLTDYYRGLDSMELDWLTCLRLSPKQIGVPDLVAVSTISNLTVLDLSDGQLYIDNRESTFDQRVLRVWSDLARTGKAFRNLRVLLLGWQEKIDVWLFELLKTFPRLNLVVVTDCRNIHHKNHKDWEQSAEKFGWEVWPSKRGVKYLRPLFDDRSFVVGNISNLHAESVAVAKSRTDALPVARSRPLLECWLGTPRVWKHIVEEFPGTRTVLLQRKSLEKGIPSERASGKEAGGKREPSSPASTTATKRMHKEARRRTLPQE
ncbi:hypothetical protein LTR64_000765 [Lithohypha guttulata]|uniref:uncharacterized protein n=1 Tax=Lithohypha guttulata TaxID=1690604 RepID=UPI002DE00ACD|nr:hypothetical protein LTR51_005468 [Lithohypha guttulata]